jgi:signal transduction histidine kinase
VLTIFSNPTNRIFVGVFFQINLTISVAEHRKMRLFEQLTFFGVLHLYLIFRLSPSLSCLLTIVTNFLHLVLISFQLRKEAIMGDSERESKNKRIIFFEKLIKEVLPCGIIFLEGKTQQQINKEPSALSTPRNNTAIDLAISYNKYFFSLFEPKSPGSSGMSPQKRKSRLGNDEFDRFLAELKVFFHEEEEANFSSTERRSNSIRLMINGISQEQYHPSFIDLKGNQQGNIGEISPDSSNIRLDYSNNYDNVVSFVQYPTVKNLLDIKARLCLGWEALLQSLPSVSLYDRDRDCVNMNLVYEPKIDRLILNNSFQPRSFTYNLQICRTIKEDDSTIYLFLFTDVSAVEHMRELEMHDKQKNKFFSTISHNLKTPLHGIIGVFEELDNFAALSGSPYEDLVKIGKRSSQILDSLVNDLLDFSLILSGKLNMHDDVVNITTFSKEILDIVRYQAKFKGLELLEERDENLPKYIITDERRLRQVLLNLLSNAIKFTEKGSVIFIIGLEAGAGKTEKNILIPNSDTRANKKYRTHVLSQTPHLLNVPSTGGRFHKSLLDKRTISEIIVEDPITTSEIVFCVSDTGKGMRKDEMKTVFKLFNKYERKSSSLKHSNPGSGIGLVIANALVKKLHPNRALGLQMESEMDIGSKFWFSIPCRVKLDNNNPNSINNMNIDVMDDIQQIAIEEKPNIISMKDTLTSGTLTCKHYVKDTERQGLLDSFSYAPPSERSHQMSTMASGTKKIKEKIGSSNEIGVVPTRGKSLYIPRVTQTKPQSSEEIYPYHQVKSMKKRDSDLNRSLPEIDLEMIEIMKKKKQQSITNSKHMLIVDDDNINITVATRYLDSFKITYKVAEHGLKALQILEEEARKGVFFDAILMDLNMPIMDGFQATKHIKEKIFLNELKPVPIVACTANVSQFDRKMCNEAGMTDFMTKPLKKLELKKKLEEILHIKIDYEMPKK